MKNKRLKFFFFLIPIFLIFLSDIVLTVYDVFLGDSDGNITTFWVNQSSSTINLFLLLMSLFFFLKNTVKVSIKIIVFNFFIIILICYAFNYILSKRDVYILNNINDTNYYYSNYSKYFNILPPPPMRCTWGNFYNQNDYGFRGNKISYLNKKSFLVVGDSYTWGAGLSDEDRYTNKLEVMLQKIDSNYCVNNFALSGACTKEVNEILEDYISKIKPIQVVYGFCFNDLTCKKQNYSIELEQKNNTWKSFLNKTQISFSTLRLNYTGELFVKLLNTLLDIIYNVPSFEIRMFRFYEKKSKEWKTFEQTLRKMYKSSTKHSPNSPLLAVFTQSEWIKHNNNKAPNDVINMRKLLLKQVSNLGEEIGFKVVDYSKVIDEMIINKTFDFTKKLQVSPLDGHPSKYLNEIFAEEIFKKFLKENNNNSVPILE